MPQQRPRFINLTPREAAIVVEWARIALEDYGDLDPAEQQLLNRLRPVAALLEDLPDGDDRDETWVLCRVDTSSYRLIGGQHFSAAAAEAAAKRYRRAHPEARVLVVPDVP